MTPAPFSEHVAGRFWKYVAVVQGEGCWQWLGGVSSNGYGTFQIGSYEGRKRVSTPHRWVYQYTHGELPASLQVDHLCRNRLCVRPDHLEAVTQQENIRRASAHHTTCPQGHAYDEANTRWDRAGHRHCRTCQRERDRARPKRSRPGRYRTKAVAS